jgi:hypothetical protein
MPTTGPTPSACCAENKTFRSGLSCGAPPDAAGADWRPARARTWATSQFPPKLALHSSCARRPLTRSVTWRSTPNTGVSRRPAPGPHLRWLETLLAQGRRIAGGFDRDAVGEGTARAMIALHSTIQRLRPAAHDWNDQLQARSAAPHHSAPSAGQPSRGLTTWKEQRRPSVSLRAPGANKPRP